MPTAIDHYAVLGVGRGASPDEIRGAYRRAARASHPDLHPEDSTAAERFKRVQLAYDVLGDPARRASYDAPTLPRVVVTPSARRAGASTPAVYGAQDDPVSLARELSETVRAIRVVARRSGFARRVRRLIRYLEQL
jgi:curved DNA-binding protein CbpA